jgi:hypothetical protein
MNVNTRSRSIFEILHKKTDIEDGLEVQTIDKTTG